MEATPTEGEARPDHDRDCGHLDRDDDRRWRKQRVREDEATHGYRHEQKPNKRGNAHV
jgi:hypothetical protein